ncbi:MAG: OmpA family protein [Bacteroidetes bacterium]|nr:OmpA family protein [Bacteroidota bacterium]MCB0842717.1 OmpA family protein [Bacteroidota bacterium]
MKLSVTVTRFMVLLAATSMLASCVSKKKYDEAMTRAAAEKSALESSLATAQEENEKLKADAEELQKNLSMSKDEIKSLSVQIKESNDKIAQLRSAISSAFETYDKNDIKVEERNGKLYVTMANSILFDSGRDKIKKESKDMLAQFAGIIKKNTGLRLMVEGHTDNEPVKIHKGQYTDNWGLSVARSLSVVRELAANGVDANHLSASGKGDTQPIASNDTDAGKEKNRRTEFVIIPKVEGLYKMYNSGFDKSGDSSN